MKENSYFISFCNDDVSMLILFRAVVEKIGTSRVFFTFDEKNTTEPGRALSPQLREKLKEQDVMIALVTEAYMRSSICVSELVSRWYLGETVIPIIFGDKKKAAGFVKDFLGETVFIDLSDDTRKSDKEACIKAATALTREFFGDICGKEQEYEVILKFCREAEQGETERKYIGMSDSFFKRNINVSSPSFGIHYLNPAPLPFHESSEKMRDKEMNEWIIMATTGQALIHNLTNYSDCVLADMLKNGASVTVLVPNLNSEFVLDVSKIEGRRPDTFENEFHAVLDNLFSVANSVKESEKDLKGHLYFGCCFSLLRQTVVIGKKASGESYGWISATMPPGRTASNALTVGFEGKVDDNKTLASSVYGHAKAVLQMAKDRKALFELTGNAPDIDYLRQSGFGLQSVNAKRYWISFYDSAHNFMLLQAGRKDVLIEVAAQHPLVKGCLPAEEFQERLNLAEALYRRFTGEGRKCYIYIPGSRHQYNGKADKISLSEAGKNYLLDKGIPEGFIFGEAENVKYKKDQGVYNSADECFVASELFKSEDHDFGQIHCICSSAQLIRKKLFYIAFGVIPIFHTADTNNLFHSDMDELFDSIPEVILRDHTWQEVSSIPARKARVERVPDVLTDEERALYVFDFLDSEDSQPGRT